MAAVVLIHAQSDREVVPAAPFLPGVAIKAKAITRNFPKHLHTYLLVIALALP